MVGDAAGGPYEFTWPLVRNEWSTNDRALNKDDIQKISDHFKLVDYNEPPDPYGPWTNNSAAGTITDDSRFKMIFITSLGKRKNVSAKRFAKTLLDYPNAVQPEYRSLADRWLKQFVPSALYISGKTKDERAKPPETIWAGVPTNLGQMAFLPLAAVYPGQPEKCYLETWEVDYFDFGYSKDMHASINAGLSHAFLDTATWAGIKDVMKSTDPYQMNEIPWAKRRTAYWIKFAEEAAERSEGKVSKLFEILEQDMHAIQWWDTWVPLVIMISIGELTAYDPKATLQLSLEFGYDTDSYAQLIGAFMGALHGTSIFEEKITKAVEKQLDLQYKVSLNRLVDKVLD